MATAQAPTPQSTRQPSATAPELGMVPRSAFEVQTELQLEKALGVVTTTARELAFTSA